MSECPYCVNSFEMNDTCHDEFRMWQGLVGPYYIPTIDEDGNLSWTNTGELPNPAPVNVIGPQGNGLLIAGIAETTGDLPETAANGVTWLVGAAAPYEGYVYLNGEWNDIGEVTLGPAGPQGLPGVGVPSGGTTGQVLQKASNSDYQTEWADPASGGDPPGTMLPLMDGTAAVGTARSYAREDHVHPQDSEIGELKTSLNSLSNDVDGIETALSNIGTVLVGTNSASLDVPNASYTTLSTLALPAGKWIVVAGHAYSSSFTTICSTQLYYVGGAAIPGTTLRFSGENGGGVNIVTILENNATETIGLRAYQSSGTTKTANSVSLQAIRIA